MKSFWNMLAKQYDKNAENDLPSYEKLVEKITPYLNKNSIVLEIATGTGIIANMIAPYCSYIDATDYSEEMIKRAKAKVHPTNVMFALQDVSNLTYKDNSYNLVIMVHALHVVPDPQKALDSMKRVLKQDGILIIATYTPPDNSSDRFIRFLMKIFGFRTWTKEQYIDLFGDWSILKVDDTDKETNTTFFVLQRIE